MARKQPVQVGFDFDGVVAYNPLRTMRMPLMMMAKVFSKKKKKTGIHFPYPKNPVVRYWWEQAHKTSHFPAPGFEHLKTLLREKKIEGHIITGRYSFLNDELYDWLTKNDIVDLFASINVDMKNEQPHLFKEKMLKKLKLPYFVEDNLDIVRHLDTTLGARSKAKSKVEVHWIYNIIDRFAPYDRKHPHLKTFLQTIEKQKS